MQENDALVMNRGTLKLWTMGGACVTRNLRTLDKLFVLFDEGV